MTSLGPCVHGHPARILVVDDEPDNAAILELVLTGEGFVVLACCSGGEALATLGASLPDLIVLDVMMPGVDGFSLARTIKDGASTRHIPVVLFTAMPARHAEARAAMSGADGVLSKPTERRELVRRLKVLLRATYADYSEGPP